MVFDKFLFCENNCFYNEVWFVLIWSILFFGWMVYFVIVKLKVIVFKKGFFKYYLLYIWENWRFVLFINYFIGVYYFRFL